MAQRLKQNNEGASLLLTPDDFLIARETPRLVSDVLRHIRRRIGRDGYAEQAVHEHEGFAGRFSYYHTKLSQDQMAALLLTLMKAYEALVAVSVPEDPNGVYRSIEFWVGDRPVKLRMQDVGELPCFDIPEFETAWQFVVQQFPVCR